MVHSGLGAADWCGDIGLVNSFTEHLALELVTLYVVVYLVCCHEVGITPVGASMCRSSCYGEEVPDCYVLCMTIGYYAFCHKVVAIIPCLHTGIVRAALASLSCGIASGGL